MARRHKVNPRLSRIQGVWMSYLSVSDGHVVHQNVLPEGLSFTHDEIDAICGRTGSMWDWADDSTQYFVQLVDHKCESSSVDELIADYLEASRSH